MNTPESYAIKILAHMQGIFEEDSDNYIDIEDFNDPENFKSFIHAFSTVCGASMFNKIVDASERRNNLTFNHMLNHLVFEYSLKDEE